MAETKVFLGAYLITDKCFFNLGKSHRETSQVIRDDGVKHESSLIPKMISQPETSAGALS